MITYSSRIVNNTFQVTFDFTPKDVICSRGNYTATHKGAGTSSRQGIWEGIEIIDVQTKIGNSPWVSHGKSSSVTVSTTDNNVPIQGWARYQLKTMGYHFQCTNGAYPFFYYGNIGGNPKRYSKGYFTDSRPEPPSQLHNINAIVPIDWTHVETRWSDWAYEHANSTSNWAFDDGRYEQRNGNYESANSSNGWISDVGYQQAWRKSCMFYFRKDFYSATINSSGIVKDARTPEINVIPSKGDSGLVTLKYLDNNGADGKFKLVAYCNNKAVNIETFESSSTYRNGQSKTYSINFVSAFGESYAGNDVTYEAWAQNTYNKVSKSTGRKGGHRFNAAPSIPTNISVTGRNDIIYNDVTFNWKASTDKDNDSVSYILHLKAISKKGNTIKNNIIASNINRTSYLYSIANDPDGCRYEVKVKATDGLKESNWSQTLLFEKGSKPTNILSLISPIKDNGIIYSTNPRFVFTNHDKESDIIINCNDVEYNSRLNPELFAIDNEKVMFLANRIANDNQITIYAILRNKYGEANKSHTYRFTKKRAYENVNEDDIAKASVIKEIQKQIIEKDMTYTKATLKLTEIIPKQTYITSKIYNECYKALKAINDSINSIINTDKFKVELTSKPLNELTREQYNDDKLWKNLVEDIKNI